MNYQEAEYQVWMSLILLTEIALIVALIVYAATLVRMFRLDKGFEEDRIVFDKLKTQDILKMAIFLIGGILILDSFPDFLSHAYQFLQQKASHSYMNPPKNDFGWALSTVNLFIGFLLLTNYDWVAKKLNLESKKNEEPKGD